MSSWQQQPQPQWQGGGGQGWAGGGVPGGMPPQTNGGWNQQAAGYGQPGGWGDGGAGAYGQPPPPGGGYGQQPPPAGGMGGFGGSVQLDAATMQNMQGMATNIAMDYGQQMAGKLNANINRYMPVDSLRYYFQLNNSYVLNKIRVLLLPFRHKGWTRALTGTGSFCEPRHDINAPDLYLPTMAFVTYILLIAYHLGQQGRFTPEVFGLTASKGLGVVLLEVTLMKATFYLFPSSAHSPGAAVLDLLAYSGYKFVAVVVNMMVGLVVPTLLHRVVSLYTAMCTGFFVLKTLTEIRGSATLTPEVMKQNYCIFALAGLQLIFAWYLHSGG